MSDEENENRTDEKTPTKDKPAKKVPPAPPNPFLSSLRDNQVAQAKEALMKTVCENPENTLGSIIEALENDTDGEYIMFEIFKGLTVEELVRAAAPSVVPGWGKLGKRGPRWEATTAASYLQAGADILALVHPEAIAITRETIGELMVA